MKFLDGVSRNFFILILIVGGEKYVYRSWEGIPDYSVCTLKYFITTDALNNTY